MRGKRTAAISVTCGLALFVAACGEAPQEDATEEKDFKGCMVTDMGGLDDRSFNTSAWAGMQNAEKKDPSIQIVPKESKAQSDYETNLQDLIAQDCDLILAVGGLMTDALAVVAEENPDQQFAIVDSSLVMDNVYAMEFNTAQSSFLAGYVAAGVSKTGKVATFGGLNIPSVTIFMDGYYEGVQYYNEENDTNVEVLGWDPNKGKEGEGVFAESFDDTGIGTEISRTFIDQGADVVFPVAGKTGVGAPTVTAEDPDLHSIWVDTDGRDSVPEYADEFLTTSVKNITGAVEDLLIAAASGKPLTGRSVGTLENEGVSVAEFNDAVNEELTEKVNAVKQKIIDGEIVIESKKQPTAE